MLVRSNFFSPTFCSLLPFCFFFFFFFCSACCLLCALDSIGPSGQRINLFYAFTRNQLFHFFSRSLELATIEGDRRQLRAQHQRWALCACAGNCGLRTSSSYYVWEFSWGKSKKNMLVLCLSDSIWRRPPTLYFRQKREKFARPVWVSSKLALAADWERVVCSLCSNWKLLKCVHIWSIVCQLCKRLCFVCAQRTRRRRRRRRDVLFFARTWWDFSLRREKGWPTQAQEALSKRNKSRTKKTNERRRRINDCCLLCVWVLCVQAAKLKHVSVFAAASAAAASFACSER